MLSCRCEGGALQEEPSQKKEAAQQRGTLTTTALEAKVTQAYLTYQGSYPTVFGGHLHNHQALSQLANQPEAPLRASAWLATAMAQAAAHTTWSAPPWQPHRSLRSQGKWLLRRGLGALLNRCLRSQTQLNELSAALAYTVAAQEARINHLEAVLGRDTESQDTKSQDTQT